MTYNTNSNNNNTRLFVAGIVATLIVIADQLSKLWVRRALPAESSRLDIIPNCLSFIHRKNPGIAFSMFSTAKSAPLVFAVISLFALAFIAWIIYKYKNLPGKIVIALSAVAGGAAGNFIDRIIPPHKVVDFIDCYIGSWHWPAFNVADSAICIGAAILVISSFTNPNAFSSQVSSQASSDGGK